MMIPEEKWFTNLYTRGTWGPRLSSSPRGGDADRTIQKGDTVLLMVPESGRFMVSFARLTVVDGTESAALSSSLAAEKRDIRWTAPAPRDRSPMDVETSIATSPLPEIAKSANVVEKYLGVELALVWADFERMLRAVPMVQRIEDGEANVDDYKRLLVNLRQQVIEGARWIARAASNVSIELFPLRSMFIGHAGDEHKDYQMLERDFVAVGGTLEEIVTQPKNIAARRSRPSCSTRPANRTHSTSSARCSSIEGLGMKKAARWRELCGNASGSRPSDALPHLPRSE